MTAASVTDWQLAAELRGLIVNRPASPAAERANHGRQREIQRILADRFGELRGWRLSPTRFSLLCLSRGGHHDSGWNSYSLAGVTGDSQTLDHLYHYRRARRPYPAVGIIAHLYNWPDCAKECHALAAQHGCVVVEVGDFPSWWYPEWSRLVLYTARAR